MICGVGHQFSLRWETPHAPVAQLPRHGGSSVGGLATIRQLGLSPLKRKETMVGDGDPVGISKKVLDHLSRTAEFWFSVADPVLPVQPPQELVELFGIAGVSAMIETVPLEKAAEAYARMMAGQARLRMVLTITDQTVRPNF